MDFPKKMPEFVLVALVCLVIGYGTGAVLTERKKMVTLENSITLKWSDGVFNDPPLGAHVYLEPHMAGKSVRLRVYHGRNQPLFYMPGPIGEIDVLGTAKEAASKWSKVEWRKDGLHVGIDGNRTLLQISRDKISPAPSPAEQ
jgi:hypothetical protein